MTKSYPYAVFETHYGTGCKESPHSVHLTVAAAKAEVDRLNRRCPAGVVNHDGSLNGFGYAAFHWGAEARDRDLVDELTPVED